MTLKSMTGFASRDGTAGSTSWRWEVRSVNGRGLDIRLRLPAGLESIEPQVREAVAKRLARGSVAVNLSTKRSEGVTQIRLNETALHQVLTALDNLKNRIDVAPPSVDALFGIKGVLEHVEPDENDAEVQERNQAMFLDFEHALDDLLSVRSAEGSRLEAIVREQLLAIERLTQLVANSPARSVEAIRARLKEQVGRLLESNIGLDEGRLYQEAAMLASRADVEEELKRIGSHIEAARDLLSSEQPAGRKLDFLAQEFNREANTLCSKASDADTTRAGLDLKAVIDQMREQVQNVE